MLSRQSLGVWFLHPSTLGEGRFQRICGLVVIFASARVLGHTYTKGVGGPYGL